MKTKVQNKKQSGKQQLMAALSMLLIAAIALTSATYAWFTFVSNPEVRGMDVYVKAADNIFLSPYDLDVYPPEADAYWFPTLQMKDDSGAEFPNGIWNQQKGAFPKELGDVSSLFNLSNRNFFSRENEDNGDFKQYVVAIPPDTWTPAAGKDTLDTAVGTYAKFDLWIKSSKDAGTIFLDEKDANAIVQSYVKAILSRGGEDLAPANIKNNIASTFRIGFYCANDMDGTSGQARCVVWEPNSKKHVLPVDGGLVPGASVNAWFQTLPITAASACDANGVSSVASVQQTYDFNTTTAAGARTDRIPLFNLEKDTPLKFSVYIWVEGADVDTVNAVAKSWAQIQLRFGQAEDCTMLGGGAPPPPPPVDPDP